MKPQAYLTDTNIFIHLEDNRTVEPAFADFISLAAKHKVDVFVHEAARDDIERDRDIKRRKISLSKLEKFQILAKVRDLTVEHLRNEFGKVPRPNDIVDATLLHALKIGAVDFLVTQDRGLHERARYHSPELGRRVLYVADAAQLLRTTFESIDPSVRYVEEVSAHTISLEDPIFDSLREDYIGFDTWWTEKCIKLRRPCWIVEDDGVAGILVRKDENAFDTDATQKAAKILKICTFKVRPEKRGLKIGELLLKKAFWFAQRNNYDLIYVTTFEGQNTLIDHLEYFGFHHTMTKQDGELIYEKSLTRDTLLPVHDQSRFDTHRLNYPRFVAAGDTEAFIIPIREGYHDVLYPDLCRPTQFDLFDPQGKGSGPKRPGNTIRKVYLCRSQSNLGRPGALLMFYKGKSALRPSQAITAIGVLEDMRPAESTRDLLQMTGGRSVYSEKDLNDWKATKERPVKVINYLLAAYTEPEISIHHLGHIGIHVPQSISRITPTQLRQLLNIVDLGFAP